MTATSFIDTNILLYAASNAPADQAKRQIARGLLGQADIGFSVAIEGVETRPTNQLQLNLLYGRLPEEKSIVHGCCSCLRDLPRSSCRAYLSWI